MNILFNVSTRRGIVSILPLMNELKDRGHNLYTLVTTHPSAGLKHPHKFMIGPDADMLELLDGITEYKVYSVFDDFRQMYHVLVDIADWNIDVHITKGDSGLPRDRLLCAGIRSQLPHISIYGVQADWHMHIKHPYYSSKFMVMGQRWMEYLTSMGVPYDNISVVGCIKGDYLLTLPHISDDYITFFSQMTYSDEQKESILVSLNNIATCMNKKLIVKLHPAWEQYNVDEWGWWTDRIKSNNAAHTELRYLDDPYELMQNSALVITAFSNTGYEAMIMGIPVVILNISEEQDFYRGCGVDIYSTDDLPDMVEYAMRDKSYTSLIEWEGRQYHTNDGRASNRAANCIEGWYNG